MTPVVVEVGPQTVCGPGSVSPQWIATALDCIDDPIALLDGYPVDVSGLWRDVLDAAAGERPGPLVLVVPTWWSTGRVGVIADAAGGVASDVMVRRRSEILAATDATLVELSTEYAAVTSPPAPPRVFARDAAEFTAHLETVTAVVLDVPAGVPPLPAASLAAIRRAGKPLTYCTGDRLLQAAEAALAKHNARDGLGVGHIRPGRRSTAVLAGAVLTVAAVGGGWAAQTLTGRLSVDGTRMLVDGSVALRVPAQWSVERITSGSGSARLRVAASGGVPALHVTQSAHPGVTSIADVAESLRRAIGSEPDGVFVDFDPTAERGGRPAVTYVERRADGDTRWSVVVDGVTRIAIGCQGAPTAVEDVCLEAVLSAHAVK